MNCDSCEKKTLQISKINHEMEMARLERINFSLLMALILAIVLLFGCCMYFLKYKSKIEMIILEENVNGPVLENRNKHVDGSKYNFDYHYP